MRMRWRNTMKMKGRNSKMTVDSKTVRLFNRIAKILAPPPELTVSQWADAYRKLSPESASEPGQ